jgi:ribonuclease III
LNILLPYRLIFSPDKKLFFSLKNIIGFYPENIAVYKLAFSHRSINAGTVNGIPLTNERLEFLGDAILGAVIADMLFRLYPFRDEGFLTEMRSRLVSRAYLKTIALKIGIDKFMNNKSAPGMFRSMHGDAFEALIGAIFIDKGYRKTQDFIVNRIIKFHTDLNEIEMMDHNYKSKIINWAQRNKKSISFETVDEDVISKLIKVRLVIEGKEISTGEDFVKKKAEQIAAEKACATLGVE